MKKFLVMIAAAIVLSNTVFAQSGEQIIMTVEEAVQYALSNSYELKTGALDLAIKERAAGTAWNVLLPTAQVTGSASRANEVATMAVPGLPTPEVKEDDHWRLVGGLSLGWNFSAAYLQQIKTAKLEYDAGQITWEQTQKSVELNVRKLFYGLLMMQESIKISESSLKAAEDRAAQAQINFRNGRVPEIQLLQAQVAVENQKPALLKARQSLKDNLNTLAFLLGMKSGTEIVLSGEIEPAFVDLNAENLIKSHVGGRLDVLSLEKNIEILNMNKSALKLGAYTPAISVSFGLQPVAGLTQFKDDGINAFSENGSLSVSLAFNIMNLFPFSATQQNIKTLDDNITKLRISVEMLSESAKNEIITAVNTLELSKSQIAAMEASINLAERAYNATAASYRAGTSELLDVRDAENSLNQAKLGLLNEKYNYLSGLLDLENKLNTKLGN
jgi:outer membrane protein TolC